VGRHRFSQHEAASTANASEANGFSPWHQCAALGSTTVFKDSEHPNDNGYAKMADVWYAAIRDFLR